MNHSLKEDRQLLKRCLSGDRRASDSLVRRYSNLVYHSIQSTLKIKHVAFTKQDLEDLHNTVFLRLFEQKGKKLRQYKGKNRCTLASWIRLIAIRTVLDHLKNKGLHSLAAQKDRIPIETVEELRESKPGPLDRMEKIELERLIQEGVQRLPSRDRLFIKLHFNHGLPIAEVAAAMKFSVENAYTLKHRAIQRLKARIKEPISEVP